MAEERFINFDQLNELLGKVNLEDVTAESNEKKFEELPDGYYLSEVESAELGVSKTNKIQVRIQLKVVEDGIGNYIDERGNAKMMTLEHTKNRKIFKYYPLVEEKDVNRFVSDMLKFEGDVPGEPLLPKEAFTTGEVLEEALEVLTGARLYVQATTTTKKGTDERNTWFNLISWNRVKDLELPD